MSDPVIWEPVVGFTTPHVWSGEYFDLSLEFVSRDVTQLVAASRELWSHPDLQGCWLDRDREPDGANRMDAPAALEEDEHFPYGPPEYWSPPTLYGLARIPGGSIVPCASWCGLGGDYMYMSLDFNANALRKTPSPRGVDGGVTGLPLCDWLAEVAVRIHRVAPILVGVMGWETTTPKPEGIKQQKVTYDGLFGYVLPRGTKLEYEPPGRFSAP